MEWLLPGVGPVVARQCLLPLHAPVCTHMCTPRCMDTCVGAHACAAAPAEAIGAVAVPEQV